MSEQVEQMTTSNAESQLTQTSANADDGSLDTFINYGGRLIDIQRFIGINDYWVRAAYNPVDRSLFWIRHAMTQSEIVRLPWTGESWSEAAAEVLASYGRRSFWRPNFNEKLGSLFVIADEDNNEAFNVYRFAPGDEGLTQVSDVGYTFGYAFSPVTNRLVMAGRKELSGIEAFLFEMDPDDPDSLVTLVQDSPEYRIESFQPPVIDDEDRRLAVTLKKNGKRDNTALGIFRRGEDGGGELDIIDPPGQQRTWCVPIAWRGDQLILAMDFDKKNQDLFLYDDTTREFRCLLRNERPLVRACFDRETDRILVQTATQDDGELSLVDAATGEILRQQEMIETVLPWQDMICPMGGSEYLMTTREGKTRAFVGIFNCRGESEPLMRVGFEPEVQKNLVSSCDMYDVSYATFDMHDGAAREIASVLFEPHNLPSIPAQRSAVIYAHGGPTANTAKSWSADIQFLTSLGYIVFGPNPRGSYGHGRKFESLNDKDWGGGDYRDYCYGLTYLIRRYELNPRRVGIFGGSYGGYMTNWAITRPNTPFAFGISLYGISNLFVTVKESVIAGMTLTEMGDPEEHRDLYVERSPFFWAEHVASPLLLIHGSRDKRTVTKQSSEFYTRLKSLGKDVEYLEVEGEGHGFKTVKARVESMQAMADFLWRCAPIPSEEALEEMQVLEDMREEFLNVFHEAMLAAVCPTEENKRHIQSLFDQAREHLWARAVELRGNGEECEACDAD